METDGVKRTLDDPGSDITRNAGQVPAGTWPGRRAVRHLAKCPNPPLFCAGAKENEGLADCNDGMAAYLFIYYCELFGIRPSLESESRKVKSFICDSNY